MKEFQTSIMKGNLSTLIRISFPIMLYLFCEALTLFCERIFLSNYSPYGLHSALNATYLANIFQLPCIAIATMAQVFVGLYQGKADFKSIGPCVWQLIWFSFLSLFITVPLSLWSSSLYFKGSLIQQSGTEYFMILAVGNFLFPFSTALIAFYLGRGKTLLVTFCTLLSYALQLLLSRLLIFGFKGMIPELGIRGGALAKCLSLGIFCLFFFCAFLTKQNRKIYHTGFWYFSLGNLWTYMRPGLIRAFGYFIARLAWVIISYIVIQKGEEYLNIQTIGGTVITFFVFIPIGIYRSILTIASNLLGARKLDEIWRLCRSCLIYLAIIAGILGIPLLVFPRLLIYFFDPTLQELFIKTFETINHWIWFHLISLSFQMSLCAVLVAARDLRIQFYMYLATFLTSLLPVYFLIHLEHLSADKLWLIMAFENIIFGLVYFLRLRQKKWEEIKPAL